MILKKRIKEKGFTHEQVAKSLGISRSTFQQRLAYDSMSTNSLRKIAEVIGCKIGDFFTDEMSDDLPEDDKEYWYVLVMPPNCSYTPVTFKGKLSLSKVRRLMAKQFNCKPYEIGIINQFQVTESDFNELTKQA